MKTCLVVVYNHYFPSNISRIDKLYEGRFSRVVHLLPFAEHENESVLSVGRSSHHFQGYVYDSREALLATGCDRFLFIADDVFLNPQVAEPTLDKFFGLADEDDSFLHQFGSLGEIDFYWSHAAQALSFEVSTSALNLTHAIPDRERAEEIIRDHGEYSSEIYRKSIYASRRLENFEKVTSLLDNTDRLVRRLFGVSVVPPRAHKSRNLRYPLAYGYSDIFLVSRENLPIFARYCGAFAAAGLFVEIALPTALALSSRVIRTQKDSPLAGGPLWGPGVSTLDRFDRELELLVQDFPPEWLFVHPVKLSEWNDH